VCSNHFLDGGPAVAACKGNENWQVIQAERQVLNLYSKVSVAVLHGTAIDSPSTTVHRYNCCWYWNINSDSAYEPLLIYKIQQQFHVEPLLIMFFRQVKNPMPFFPIFFLFLQIVVVWIYEKVVWIYEKIYSLFKT
jgi:hypothetical protein